MKPQKTVVTDFKERGKTMEQVVVVIPNYKAELNAYDRLSVSRTCEVLKDYPIVMIHPEGLDLSAIRRDFPQLRYRSFNPEYFSGIMGYNRLMLSTSFYEAFSGYEYMLICQTDAYVFRDELREWCMKGYDYVGAPWLKKRLYDFPVMRLCMRLSLWWKHCRGKRSKQELYGKVGNGGLSLRKVASHIETLRQKSETVERYLDRKKKYHLFNEDVFWALEPDDFRYPTAEEALLFAFDKYPQLSFSITGGRLPMGCHAWYKRKMKAFWENRLPDIIL